MDKTTRKQTMHNIMTWMISIPFMLMLPTFIVLSAKNHKNVSYSTQERISLPIYGATIEMDSAQFVSSLPQDFYRSTLAGIRTTHRFELLDFKWDYATVNFYEGIVTRITCHKYCSNVRFTANEIAQKLSYIYRTKYKEFYRYSRYGVWNYEQGVKVFVERGDKKVTLTIDKYLY